MLESLTERLGNALRGLRGGGRLTEDNMTAALQEVRTALLSADVHFRVAREFVDRVKDACVGKEVLKSVTPGQTIIKIINDELVTLLGEGAGLPASGKSIKIVLVGLHGAGKTTSAAKLAKVLAKQGRSPLLVACDVYRPAAFDQLETLAAQSGVSFYGDRNSSDPVAIAARGLSSESGKKSDAVIFDTAGRLQIDGELVEEIKRLCAKVNPDEVLLVADSALGQEAVNVAKSFHAAVPLTGIVLTKLDGDARGGAALSMRAITGVPIKYVGTGEKVDDFDLFYPDRMASRILGMGDVISLVEKAQETIDQDEAERVAEKLRKAEFDFEDFLSQLQQVKKMGPLGNIMEMLPGMSGVKVGNREENQLKKTEAIILSMTAMERRQPRLLSGSRRMRIARGSGTQVRDVNVLIKQFSTMRKMMKKMKGGKGRKMMQRMEAMGGQGALPGPRGMGGFPR
jgi:signal recognition particle subunit SRP54